MSLKKINKVKGKKLIKNGYGVYMFHNLKYHLKNYILLARCGYDYECTQNLWGTRYLLVENFMLFVLSILQ